ncbi:MAG: SCO1664 family protein [Candidatus Limnocylindrales bacterium]
MTADESLDDGATIAGLTRAEMEAAALEGRQVAGRLEKETALRLLRDGEMTVVGRLLSASNATFFCLVAGAGNESGKTVAASCVYKPIRGERPLYDFPDGTLACREVAAHAVSEASGWEIVPPTVMRDGPFGEGMVQLWMEVDETVDIGQLIASDNPALRHIAVIDAALNNADRKGGHLLPLPDGRIHGIDNGLCFAVEPKLRTVLWRWRGQSLTADERAVLERLRRGILGDLGEQLQGLLSPAEVEATSRRIETLLANGVMPRPDRNRPAVPWPPY